MRHARFLLSAALLTTVCTAGNAQSMTGVRMARKRASTAYQVLSSFQALFRQRFDDKAMETPESRGTLYQEGKNLFAMRFSDPPKDAIVADGTWLWVYTPSDSPGQVPQFPQQNHPTYGIQPAGNVSGKRR